jgi:hypothetical protein
VTRFEYKVVEFVEAHNGPNFEQWLNALGAEGWELVKLTELGIGFSAAHCCFKRPEPAADQAAFGIRS